MCQLERKGRLDAHLWSASLVIPITSTPLRHLAQALAAQHYAARHLALAQLGCERDAVSKQASSSIF